VSTTDTSAAPTRQTPPRPHSRQGRRLVRMATRGEAPVDRLNRTVFIVTGVVLVVAGVLGLLLYNGVLTTTEPSTIYGRWVRDATGAVNLSAAIATAVCLVVLVAAGWWALAQLRPVGDGERVGTVRITRGPQGRTSLAATTLAKAVTADLGRRPGINSARVRLRAVKPHPRVQATVEMALDTDVDAVLSQVHEAVGHLAAALETDVDEVHTEIRLSFARSVSQPGAGHPGRVS
jgi:hypothetical protein